MIIVTQETCDDNNTFINDGCSSSCQLESGYICSGSPSVCVSTCGDGVKAFDEGCDDGPDRITDNTDGCLYNCTIQRGWSCIPLQNGTSNCSEVCGNGVKTKTENCDDGGIADGDGCDQNCQYENGFDCTEDDSGITTCIRIRDSPAVVKGGSNNLVAVYAVVPTVIGLLAIGAVVVFILLRKYRKRSLYEPDYSGLAFGVDGTAAADPIPSDHVKHGMAELEALLISNNTLVMAVCNTTQSTEMDRISKALTYIFYEKGHLLEILKVRISHEIHVADSVNTLFRATSFASKMFTTYSKIIGLPYLWNTLGLIMYELRDMGSGEVESKYKSKASQRSLMSHTSIEVDPNKM